MNNILRSLNAASALFVYGSDLAIANRQLKEDARKFNELRTVARITRDYGASRPVLEMSSAVESLSVINTQVPSLENLDIIPARKNDSRTTDVVTACVENVESEPAVLASWMKAAQEKLSGMFEMSYENFGSLADAAEDLATSLESQIVDEDSLTMTPFVGVSSQTTTTALEAARELAENLSSLDEASIGSVEYQTACAAGFESFADNAILKSRGLVLVDGALETGAREAVYEPVNGSLESAGYNVPEAVAALRSAAGACRALESMLENRIAMTDCLGYGADHLPAAESIDNTSEEGQSLSGARTLVGNYTTINSQLIEGVLENTISALAAAESLKALI